jgi:hypothetical protein
MPIHFASAIPLQIKVQTPGGQLVNVEQLPPQNNQIGNTEIFANTVRPQLKELSLKTPYPAADVNRTPFPHLKDDDFSLSGMLDTDTLNLKHGTQAMLLTGPQAARNMGKAYVQQLLTAKDKQLPDPIQHQLMREAMGHNCYHTAIRKPPAQMVLVSNPNAQQAKQRPWLVASISYSPPPTQIPPAAPVGLNALA